MPSPLDVGRRWAREKVSSKVSHAKENAPATRAHDFRNWSAYLGIAGKQRPALVIRVVVKLDVSDVGYQQRPVSSCLSRVKLKGESWTRTHQPPILVLSAPPLAKVARHANVDDGIVLARVRLGVEPADDAKPNTLVDAGAQRVQSRAECGQGKGRLVDIGEFERAGFLQHT